MKTHRTSLWFALATLVLVTGDRANSAAPAVAPSPNSTVAVLNFASSDPANPEAHLRHSPWK